MNINTLIIDCDGVLNDGKQPHAVVSNPIEFSESNGFLYSPHQDTTGGLASVVNYASIESHTLTKPFKTFHSRDKTAIRRITESGVRVIIVSADDSEITKAWALSCGAEFVHERVKTLEGYGIDWETAAGIGDDIMDLVFLQKCAYSFCPSDAHPKVMASVFADIPVNGGAGVISVFEHRYEHVLKQPTNDNRVSART